MELYVRILSKTNPGKPYLCAQLHKAGDVIVVCPDNHEWGLAELSSPEHVIVCVPGVLADDLSSLTVEELDRGAGQSRVLQRRGFRVDIDKLPPAPLPLPRLGPFTLAQLMAASYRVTPLRDPNVM